jgi:hypothetical protein
LIYNISRADNLAAFSLLGRCMMSSYGATDVEDMMAGQLERATSGLFRMLR